MVATKSTSKPTITVSPVKHTSTNFYDSGCHRGVETMKVIVLGKANIGKTSLSRRYVHEDFLPNEKTTIGAAFGAKRVVINGQPIVMGIWDTAGSERYEAMSRIYYRGAKAAIICYDITDQTSFARLRFWVGELQKNESECKIYLCGTKMDIAEDDSKVRQVDVHDARDFADEIHSRLFETSSKTGENIGALFQQIAEDYAENLKDQAVLKKSTVEIRTSSAKPASHCPC